MNRSSAKSFGLTLPWSLTFLFIWLFPLGYAFVMGLTDFNLLRPDETSWVGFDNYRSLFSDEDFIKSLKNTFIFVFGTIPITTVFALALALFVNRTFK